eukprot:TRINITY_DN8888_c0_g1_i4.p1 TRINITY_DN8888_c0_g1~~TRINITY_DN8888_c0_g1_i4.p1  ORF type:complete len:452 (-),score=99.03 TRINITY_DN8888_c0_g1_i4:58-1413(-)
MARFDHVYTPMLICCYAIVGVLAVYQIYLMKRHLYNLFSFNTGFLCCCVPWCVLRISYWLLPGNSCRTNTGQLLQGFMLELPINLEFACFYFVVVYIMRQVRNAEGQWDENFKTWLRRVSLLGLFAFLACLVVSEITKLSFGTRQYPPFDPHDDCFQQGQLHPEDCAESGCLLQSETAGNFQMGFISMAHLLLALSLLFYGTKLHIHCRDAKNPRPMLNRSIVETTASIPQIAFSAGESQLVTESVVVILCVVFVSRSIFDALQLPMFESIPLSIPQDKDVDNFWIFFVYMWWEILPLSLMLFFFGKTKPMPMHTTHEKRFEAYAQPMNEEDSLEQPLEPEPEPQVPNTFWPMRDPQHLTLSSFTEHQRRNPARLAGNSGGPGMDQSVRPSLQVGRAEVPLVREREIASFMDNENRYDSPLGSPMPHPINAAQPGSSLLSLIHISEPTRPY